MNLSEKIEKLISIGFQQSSDTLIYKGHSWDYNFIENSSIAEMIKYKAYYDGNISKADLYRFLKVIEELK